MSFSAMRSIPVVDLSPFTRDGSLEERQKASKSLCNACEDIGASSIIGHGIPASLLEEAFSWNKKLFDLPHDEKMKAPHPAEPMPHRGYSPPGVEKVYSKDDLEKDKEGSSLRDIKDFKESYEIGSEHNAVQPNIWLPESTLPGYRAFTTKLYWELNKSAQMILEAIAMGLNLSPADKAHLLKLHSGHNNQLRLLHYPAVESDKLKKHVVGRMPAHQDWSSFTLVFQDDVGGLEFEDPSHPGTFLAAKPVPGAVMLNIGDMLHRFTNGLFTSALHRVTLPPLLTPPSSPENTPSHTPRLTSPRYSIPYFVAPDHEAVVSCLNTCVTPRRPCGFEPVRWCDYGEYISKHMYRKEDVMEGTS